jgi:hypothetical protein
MSAVAAAPGRWVRPSTPEDAPAICALMQEVGLPPDTNPIHQYWKYWQPRADWPGSRSYVLTDGNELLAHAAVVPGACLSEDYRLRVLHMIDWAARPTAMGGGVQIMRYLANLTDAMLAIGGSSEARKIFPLVGYRDCGLVRAYVRPLRPTRLLRTPAGSAWRRLPRFARSVLWTLAAPRPSRGPWQVRRLTADGIDRVLTAAPRARPGVAVFERTVASYGHMLECPIVPVAAYALERSGRVGGSFLLGFTPGQARLIDYWADSEDPADWRALLQCAVSEAKSVGDAAEIVAWGSDPLSHRCLLECGFHERFTLPVLLRRKSPPGAILRVQMLDSDAAYLQETPAYLWS